MLENLTDEQIVARLDLAESMHAKSDSVNDLKLWIDIIEKLIDEQAKRDLQSSKPR